MGTVPLQESVPNGSMHALVWVRRHVRWERRTGSRFAQPIAKPPFLGYPAVAHGLSRAAKFGGRRWATDTSTPYYFYRDVNATLHQVDYDGIESFSVQHHKSINGRTSKYDLSLEFTIQHGASTYSWHQLSRTALTH